MLSEYAASLIARCTFDSSNDEIACAVSGGADSLSLLALAVYSGHRATAYHVDHGIRPGSEKEAHVVERAAELLGAEFVALRVDCPAGPNLEARARTLRFAALPGHVATGHTADDQAETVLLNLLRGAGLDGLSAMRPGPRHPILGIRRFETEALVASLGLEVVHDPSNADPAYRRNRVRHELLPLLCSIADRDIVPVLSRQAAIFADEAAYLDAQSCAIDPTDVRAIRAASPALARRSIRSWIQHEQQSDYAVDADAIERILKVARGEILACEIAKGGRIRRSQGRLFFDDQRRETKNDFV